MAGLEPAIQNIVTQRWMGGSSPPMESNCCFNAKSSNLLLARFQNNFPDSPYNAVRLIQLDEMLGVGDHNGFTTRGAVREIVVA